MQKRILFVYINRFSTYPILYEYCVGLQTLGYKVFYIGLADNDETFISAEGVSVIHISKSKFKYPIHYARLVGKLSREIQPHLIHVFHFRWCFWIPVFGLFFTKYLLDVRTVHVANRKGKHSILTPFKNLLTWFESQFYRYAIALTIDVKRILTPSYKKIPIIPLGANLSKFNPENKLFIKAAIRQKLRIKESDIVFLYSGTLSPVRKIDTILYAFAQLYKEEKNIFLLIAGDDMGNNQTINDLKLLSQTLSLRNVYFTGFLSYHELIEIYLASEIGICYVPQTRYFNHQPPTKLFEYMAAGLVTVATNTEANKKIIQEGITGFLCNDNPEDLVQCFKSVMNQFRNIGEHIIFKSKEKLKEYSWEFIIQNYVHPLYKEILEK